MRRLNSTLHLRPFLRRIASSTSFLPPPPNPPFPLSSTTSTSKLLFPPTFSLSRSFCVQTTSGDEEKEVAASLSAELLRNPDAETLQLSFSHIKLTPALVSATLAISSQAGRGALPFLQWLKSRSDIQLTDEVFSYFIHFFGRRRDFKVAHDLLLQGRGVIGEMSFQAIIDRLVRDGKPKRALVFFDRMETDYGFVKSLDTLKVIIAKLCDHGYGSYAERMANNWAAEFFPDEYICDMIIKGYCVDYKLAEALRFAGEMYKGGFELSTFACNQILDCVCRLCRKKDPFKLQSEAERVLYGMEERGIPRDVETFNVLINNLCKLRKTEDAMKLFRRMGEWGCHPNETTFLVLIRSLYLAARVGEGDEMIDRMKSAGYGSALDEKEYFEILKRLCGIERINHAMSVFAMMKADGLKPGIKTYDLLMKKLVAHGLVDRANDLFKEAVNSGVPVQPKEYDINPRFVKKKRVKKEKKRETLPEKMARKRIRLQKLRLSFVKKPERRTRRKY